MITLHHLAQSRSKRIIWLLEELQVPYEIKAYQRDPQTHLAPVELKQIHPLGKSPVIQEDDLVLAESGAITEYLAEKYAANLLVPAKNTPEYAHYLQWLHFAESSAALPLLMHYLVQIDGSKPPFLSGYSLKELHLILGYLNDHLDNNTWLVGDQFTAADILLSFIIETAYKLEQLTNYPVLQQYLAALHQRPAAEKAQQLEKQHQI
ncbi:MULTISPECIES: glutathione S-transferase family protein [Vibrio]|uniref:glutathione transferase n=1 Tax=Vibrio algicola TaxID=2662262 RepID=A0A5Q0TJ36_9VIBR|nr:MULTISPECIES: glutathione S-transferase family protein [Vibrio]MBD1576156.1 glutathione S-transferase family protein [Vibrio sp. S11_S32]